MYVHRGLGPVVATRSSGGVVQDTTNTGAPRVGPRVELHSKESEYSFDGSAGRVGEYTSDEA